MKKKLTRLTALVLALALLLTSCGGGTSATSMHLRKTEGTVGVSDNEGKDVTPRNNLGLYSGYEVDTQAESYAWIDLDKVKLTKLDADSQIEISKEDKKLEINVKSGSLFFNVTEPLADDESMNIRTSTMAVGIRGTCGWVSDNTAALLEGTVEVTAGDQTVTVNAGEMAVLTADGTLEVEPFTATSVPAFVREEVAEDEELAKAVLDTIGINIAAYSIAPYKDALAEVKERGEILYTEIVDFEADGNPELMILYETESAAGQPVINLRFYRNESGEPVFLSDPVSNSLYSMKASLVESGGRLYVCITCEQNYDSFYYTGEVYCGSTAQKDGNARDWGLIETWEAHGESEYERGEAVRARYTHVRDLVSYEGTSVTVFEP